MTPSGKLMVKEFAEMAEEERARLLNPQPSIGVPDESELGTGLTDKEAVENILDELRTLLRQKEDHFKD